MASSDGPPKKGAQGASISYPK